MDGIRNVVLGIGIGIVIATIVLSFKKVPNEKMSDNEIILRAEELGMIRQTEALQKEINEEEIIERAREIGMVFTDEKPEMESLIVDKEERMLYLHGYLNIPRIIF